MSVHEFEDRWIAHGFVLRQGKALFIRRNHGRYLGGWWDVPGGSVEAHETPAEAAVRELHEESGLQGRVVSELSHHQNMDTEGRPILFHTVTYAIAESEPVQPVRIEPSEHSEYLWATFEEAMKLQLVWHIEKTVALAFGSHKRFEW